MKNLIILPFLFFLSSCSFEKTTIKYNSGTTTVSVVDKDYGIKYVSVKNIRNGDLDTVYAALEFKTLQDSVNLSNPEIVQTGTASIDEILKSPEFLYKILIVKKNSRIGATPKLIYFKSTEIKQKEQFFESKY